MSDTWWDYVRDAAGGAMTQKAIADASGIEQTVISRWARAMNPPSPEKVIAFARGVGRPPVEALIYAGYLTTTETGEAVTVTERLDLPDIDDDELLGEVARRMGAQVNAPALIGEDQGGGVEDGEDGLADNAEERRASAAARAASVRASRAHRFERRHKPG